MKDVLIVKKYGHGHLRRESGEEFSVLRCGDLWNLSHRKAGGWDFWVKENVKRLSTLQKYADNNGYNIIIKEEE